MQWIKEEAKCQEQVSSVQLFRLSHSTSRKSQQPCLSNNNYTREWYLHIHIHLHCYVRCEIILTSSYLKTFWMRSFLVMLIEMTSWNILTTGVTAVTKLFRALYFPWRHLHSGHLVFVTCKAAVLENTKCEIHFKLKKINWILSFLLKSLLVPTAQDNCLHKIVCFCQLIM